MDPLLVKRIQQRMASVITNNTHSVHSEPIISAGESTPSIIIPLILSLVVFGVVLLLLVYNRRQENTEITKK